MRKRCLTAGSLFCGIVGLALILRVTNYAHAAPGCDDIRASSSVGSCGGPPGYVTCSGYTNQNACLSFDAYEVKQDFPTSCPSSPNNNCDQPDQDCFRMTVCEWVAASSTCRINPNGAHSAWFKKPKRTTSVCNADPG